MILAPGATAWFDVMTFGAKLPFSHSNSKKASKHWTVILERKFSENSIFTGVVGDALENYFKRAKKRKTVWWPWKISLKKNHYTESNCPNAPGMTTPIWQHATGSTGLHVTSSKNDIDLTTKINYIMESTETIKLATMLSTTIWTRVHCFLMTVFKIKELNNSVNPRVKTNL